MKTTIKRLTVEIEYLRALAAMYGEGSDARVRKASLEAIISLQALLQVIESSSHSEGECLPSAA